MSEHIDNENTEQDSKLIVLPYNTKIFEAGGFKWFVEENLSVQRYRSFQKMEIELGFAVNFSTLFDKIRTSFQLLNERKDAEAAVLLHAIMEGVASISEKRPISLYVATLFINRSGENRNEWSQSIAEEKLAIWGEANIEADFFLIVALNNVQNFNRHLKEVSEMMEKVKDVKQIIQESEYPLDSN